jgi:hypothetical protein
MSVPTRHWEWFIPINDYKNDLYQKILRVVYTNKWLQERLVPKNSESGLYQ